jgi:hypothetical protein
LPFEPVECRGDIERKLARTASPHGARL